MIWQIDSAYSMLGDWGVVFLKHRAQPPLIVRAGWPEWEILGKQLLAHGCLPYEANPYGLHPVALPGINIVLEIGAESIFFDQLLLALVKMEEDRVGGAYSYYQRWAVLATHDKLPGSYGIGMVGA